MFINRRSRVIHKFLFLMCAGFSGMSLGSGCAALTSASSTHSQRQPSIKAQPVSADVTVGQTATFAVAVTGTGPFSYQWQKNGTAVSGATSSTYITPPTTAADNRALFNVVVSNSAGSATSNAATLNVSGAAVVAPSITTQPVSADVTVGQTATFAVAVTGTGPFSYQWQKNGTAVSGATSSTYITPPTTAADNRALFNVVVSNSAGSATSNAATLNVSGAAVVAPSITTQPVSADVTVGQTATFAVAVTGTGPFSYQWQKNGTAVSGATSSTYTTPPTTASDNRALFAVVVSNSAGSATSNNGTLNVSGSTGVAIAVSPNATTVSAGAPQQFTATVTGSSNTSVTWAVSAGVAAVQPVVRFRQVGFTAHRRVCPPPRMSL